MLARFFAALVCSFCLMAMGDAPPSQPNVIIILADDLAYSDIAPYGGEIDTPNLAKIAASGVTFSRFHTAPMCSPSRAMLMTGVAAHKAGYGTMAEFLVPTQKGQPGYEGYLNDQVVTLAEVLEDAGYSTAMAGKWHLGAKALPHNRGFQSSYTLVEGAGSHFDDSGYSIGTPTVTYRENGEKVELPDDFYSTDYYTDQMLRFWKERDPSRPFFGYLAYTAPHWPLHALEEDIAKYKNAYGAGYEALRKARVEKLKAAGFIPENAKTAERVSFVPPWDSLTPEQQMLEARKMAVYAAMVDRMDQNIGRLMAQLKADGALENTIFIFSSDNGPEALDFTAQSVFPPISDWVADNFDNSLDSLGSAKSYPFYGAPWAQAGAAVHSYYKTYVTEGGMHVPFIISWPQSVPQGVVTDEIATMMDVVPTVLEAAQVAHPGGQSARVHAPDGVSFLPHLKDSAPIHGTGGTGFELFGHEAYLAGDWKILRLRAPEGDGMWGLYNIAEDPGETNNLRTTRPQRFAEMKARYDAWTKDVGLIRPPEDYDMLEYDAGH